MLTTLSLHWLALTILPVALPSAAAPPVADRVRFSAEDGLERTRSLVVKSDMTTEESIMMLGEQEMKAGEGMQRSNKQTTSVSDTYEKNADGRPARLVRHYKSIDESADIDHGDSDGAIIMERGDTPESALIGRKVAFEWDADEGVYAKSFADDEEGEDGWLEDLHQDLDLRFLLPEREVEQGQRWEYGAEVLDALFNPCGQVNVQESQARDHDVPQGGIAISMPDPASLRAYDGLEGKVKATYAGTRDVDGTRCAVIELTLKFEGLQDISDLLNEQASASGMPVTDYDVADLERVFEGKGELLWDLRAGVLYAYHLEVEQEVGVELEWLADVGILMPIAMSQVLTGTLEVSLGSN